ncbi:hypothetical protein P4124_13250 [Pseudomonas aeruginosa]|nr:hypothetical protein [Pseudomonas aeruginosa]
MAEPPEWVIRVQANAHIGAQALGEMLAHIQLHATALARHGGGLVDVLQGGAMHAEQLAGRTALEQLDILIEQASLPGQAMHLPDKRLVAAHIQARPNGGLGQPLLHARGKRRTAIRRTEGVEVTGGLHQLRQD